MYWQNNYEAGYIATIVLLLRRSVQRSVFMASVVERSETPMNIGAHLYVHITTQQL